MLGVRLTTARFKLQGLFDCRSTLNVLSLSFLFIKEGTNKCPSHKNGALSESNNVKKKKALHSAWPVDMLSVWGRLLIFIIVQRSDQTEANSGTSFSVYCVLVL